MRAISNTTSSKIINAVTYFLADFLKNISKWWNRTNIPANNTSAQASVLLSRPHNTHEHVYESHNRYTAHTIDTTNEPYAHILHHFVLCLFINTGVTVMSRDATNTPKKFVTIGTKMASKKDCQPSIICIRTIVQNTPIFASTTTIQTYKGRISFSICIIMNN